MEKVLPELVGTGPDQEITTARGTKQVISSNVKPDGTNSGSTITAATAHPTMGRNFKIFCMKTLEPNAEGRFLAGIERQKPTARPNNLWLNLVIKDNK